MKKRIALMMAVLLCMVPMLGVRAAGAFAETGRVQTDSTVQLTYTLPEGEKLVEVIIGGEVCPFIGEATETSATANLLNLPAGVYRDITYAYGNPSAPQTKRVSGTPVVVAGRLDVTLTAEFTDDGRLKVTAIDQNELPVEGYGLSLELDNMPDNGKTDKNGVYTTIYTVSVGGKAIYAGLETAYPNSQLLYNAVPRTELVREGDAPANATTETTTTTTVSTPTSSSESTTTTENTTTTATAPNVTVWGAGTTAEEDGRVVMNFTTDSALLEAFGMSKTDFDAKMRFLLDEEDYKAILNGKSNKLMMAAKTVLIPPTDEEIQMAFAGVSEYGMYDEAKRQTLTFNLSLLCLSKAGNVVNLKKIPEGIEYTVQMAVPNPMKECDAFAILVKDENGLTAPQVVDVKNGMFELKLTSLDEYTLVGLNTFSGGKAGGISWWLTLILVVGIVFLAAAGLLLYFFVFRKPVPVEAPAAAEEIPAETDTDIYSGRPEVWKPEDN